MDLVWRHIVFVLMCCASAGVACAASFEVELIGTTQYTAWGSAAADFDGDGDIDAAASGMNPGTVHWYQSSFDGDPQPWVPHQVSGQNRFLSAADFDNDGDIDLMLAAYSEDAFVLLRNVGGEAFELFEPELFITDVNGPWTVEPMDLDGDFQTDFAIAVYNSDFVRLYSWQNGAHTVVYTAQVLDPTGFEPLDYDGDGDLDLLVSASSFGESGIYLITQTAPLQFSIAPLIIEEDLRVTSVAAADLDVDGDLDIVGGDFISDNVIWWEWTGSDYEAHVLPGWTSNPRDVEIVDFEQDGLPDILATSTGTGSNLRWWKNLGEGQFADSSLWDGDRPNDATIIDYDRDGDPDIVCTHQLTGQVRLYRNLMGAASQITGQVTAATGGEPIENVLVGIQENGSATLTDSEGYFTIAVAVGSHTLEFSHRCWSDTTIGNVTTVEGVSTALNVELRRPLVEVDLSSLNVNTQNEMEQIYPLQVTNTGDGLMTISASVSGNYPSDEWLFVEPATAQLGSGEIAGFTIRIAPDTTNDMAWDYVGAIELLTNTCPDSLIRIPVLAQVLDADSRVSVPSAIEVGAAYPNPFNAGATIRYVLPQSKRVRAVLLNVTGREVRMLRDETQRAGAHSLSVDAAGLATGVYFVRMTAHDFTHTQKLLYLR